MNKVKYLREALGLTKQEFVDFLGIPYQTVNSWEVRNSTPKTKFLNVFVEKIPNFNKDYFLDENEENWFKPVTHMHNDKQNDSEAVSVRNYPIYGKVSAGTAIGMWDYENKPEHKVAISHHRIDAIKDKIYGFTVFGDSMRDRLRDGDEVAAVLLDFESKKPRDGDIVVVFFRTDPEFSEPTIKLFQWTDKTKGDFILKSINPYHKDIPGNKKQILKIFRVVFNISFVDYRENKN